MRKPTVTMIPHFWWTKASMFGTYVLVDFDCRYLTVIFLSAFFAASIPCHDDALKERSSIPPVSVTMQPTNSPEAFAVCDECFAAAPFPVAPALPTPASKPAHSTSAPANETNNLDVFFTPPPFKLS